MVFCRRVRRLADVARRVMSSLRYPDEAMDDVANATSVAPVMKRILIVHRLWPRQVWLELGELN